MPPRRATPIAEPPPLVPVASVPLAGGPTAARGLPATAKGRAMRARLVAAAVECFTTRGYHATSVAEITATAGTSHGNFYRYFANVDDILVCALEPPLARLLNAARQPDRAEALDPGALQRWQQAFFAAYLPDRALLVTMREATAVDRDGRFVETWRGLRGRFVREIERWIDDVEVALGPDPDGLAAATLAETLGAMTEQTAYLHLGLARSAPDPGAAGELGRACALAYHRAVVLPRAGGGIRSASPPTPARSEPSGGPSPQVTGISPIG